MLHFLKNIYFGAASLLFWDQLPRRKHQVKSNCIQKCLNLIII